ncbi:hypothetical protein AVEN_105148-1 [Araneus ventricosus]|uniref:Uncharacterized protein n=1 Tax=Araneus ventricosus TaxID=182803 RepID=A0A4Y2T4F6_ARAVE|nr:hypothetical protein AVEN_105148-1 [Araneus ventricosus]
MPQVLPGRCFSILINRGRGGLVARSRPRDWRVAGPKPDSTEVPPCMGPLHPKSYVVAKRPPVGVAWKLGEGVPAQASSSSSDRGSKLRGQSLNSPRVASKLDVNITLLNLTILINRLPHLATQSRQRVAQKLRCFLCVSICGISGCAAFTAPQYAVSLKFLNITLGDFFFHVFQIHLQISVSQ